MWWPLYVFNICFHFFGFQLFMISKLGHVTSTSVSPPYLCHLCRLPVCVTCVASLSVSSVLPPYLCHLCRLPNVSHYLCHIMCVICCVICCQLWQSFVTFWVTLQGGQLWQVMYGSWLCHSQKPAAPRCSNYRQCRLWHQKRYKSLCKNWRLSFDSDFLSKKVQQKWALTKN